jgi:hypothetical protein
MYHALLSEPDGGAEKVGGWLGQGLCWQSGWEGCSCMTRAAGKNVVVSSEQWCLVAALTRCWEFAQLALLQVIADIQAFVLSQLKKHVVAV